ncbi:MAG: transporter, partial [Candidatus Fimimonas sp.]
ALATAPAPALSIVNEYHTDGPVTKTLIPLAAIDDVIGVVVFFSVISLVGVFGGGGNSASLWTVVGMLVVPFVVGIAFGWLVSLVLRKVKSPTGCFALFLGGLATCAAVGLVADLCIFQAYCTNYLLTGLDFSATVVNLVDKEKMKGVFERYSKILDISLVIVIVNLGVPLDYRLVAGAGLLTVVYVVSRAAGKIGGAFLGGKLTKAQPTVTKYLGFTLLPHSGVSLVFTGIAVSTLNGFAPQLADVVSGTIVAAAIINEIIAVLVAKTAFKKAGEIPTATQPANPTPQGE